MEDAHRSPGAARGGRRCRVHIGPTDAPPSRDAPRESDLASQRRGEATSEQQSKHG